MAFRFKVGQRAMIPMDWYNVITDERRPAGKRPVMVTARLTEENVEGKFEGYIVNDAYGNEYVMDELDVEPYVKPEKAAEVPALEDRTAKEEVENENMVLEPVGA